jgi:hypothetical protein
LFLQARPDLYPEFHFLMIAPNLGAEWLFDAARTYWDRYRPTILPNFNFIAVVPTDRSVIVTVIARRDTASQLGVDLAQINPNAYFDSVVYDLFDDAKQALNQRVQSGQPFGVPLTSPTPTPAINVPYIPTPRLQPTHPPAGFITEVPPPTQAPPPGTTIATPVQVTPGPLTGG